MKKINVREQEEYAGHYHLYVREKVERGLAAIDAGQVVSQEEAERRFTEWATSSGQNLR